MDKKLKKKVALPGQLISTEEEFMPGKNTFEDNGEIFSESTGIIEENQQSKEISVKPSSEPVKIPRLGKTFGLKVNWSGVRPIDIPKDFVGFHHKLLPKDKGVSVLDTILAPSLTD